MRASATDTARIALRGLLRVPPTLSAGVVVRRPRAMALAQRFQLDRSAIQLLAELRSRYGSGPLRPPTPGRELAVVLDSRHVREILHDNPQRFTPANGEKRAALSHFQPRGVLISRSRDRTRRRRFHEDILQIDQPVHELGPRIAEAAPQEARVIAERAASAGHLDWDTFAAGWWRAVRRAVLGDGARDDERLISLLNELRADATGPSYTPPAVSVPAVPATPARALAQSRDRQSRRVDRRPRRAGTSIRMNRSRTGCSPSTRPGWSRSGRSRCLPPIPSTRAARDEIEAADGETEETPVLPYLRSCLLDAVRRPTTPALLRDSVAPTQWGDRTLPAGAGLFVFTPLFHRDETWVQDAHRFSHARWLDDLATRNPALVPFSDGPGRCPGRNLVLLLTSSLLAELLQQRRFSLRDNTILDPIDRSPPSSTTSGSTSRSTRRRRNREREPGEEARNSILMASLRPNHG